MPSTFARHPFVDFFVSRPILPFTFDQESTITSKHGLLATYASHPGSTIALLHKAFRHPTARHVRSRRGTCSLPSSGSFFCHSGPTSRLSTSLFLSGCHILRFLHPSFFAFSIFHILTHYYEYTNDFHDRDASDELLPRALLFSVLVGSHSTACIPYCVLSFWQPVIVSARQTLCISNHDNRHAMTLQHSNLRLLFGLRRHVLECSRWCGFGVGQPFR